MAKKSTGRRRPGRKRSVATEKAQAILEQFPDAKTNTLARMLLEKHPKTYRDKEHARTTVRYLRGAMGSKLRDAVEGNPEAIGPQEPGSGFGRIPEPWVEIPDWKVEQLDGEGYWGILQDFHCPFHDVAAVKAALQYTQERDPVGLILNGDIADCHSVGYWQKDPDKRDFQKERLAMQELLGAIRDIFPDIPIIYKEGNHEERLESYLTVKAPELFGVPDFHLKSLYGLDDLNIQWVGDKRPIRVGKLYVIHGHEYRFSISNPVNPARGLFLRSGVNAVAGHFHQPSAHSARNLGQKVVSCQSFGCLCDLHPKWLPLNQWSHGWGGAWIDGDGAFTVENKKLLNGKVY